MEYISVALADTIMGRYPDPRSIPYREWCYVQGYILAGFEKLFESTLEPGNSITSRSSRTPRSMPKAASPPSPEKASTT